MGSEIALRYGITVAMLKAANPEVDLDFLKEGQQLIIPSKSETAVPLAFTPTPMMLSVQTPHCYPTADKGAWCLVLVENNQPEPVYYLSGDFSLQADEQIRTVNVAALVDTLGPDEKIPLIARFDPPFPYPFQIQFHLNSAFTAENPVVWKLELKAPQAEIDPSGLTAKLTGGVVLSDQPVKTVAVIGVAYHGDRPVGIRRVEFPVDPAQPQVWPFEIELYTTGLSIDRVEFFSEGR